MNSSQLGYWVCAAFQHIRIFSLHSSNIDEYEVTLLCGETACFLNAIRGRNVVSQNEAERLAKAQQIGTRKLTATLLPALQRLNSERLTIIMGKGGIVIEEYLDSMRQMFGVIGDLWESLNPSIVERGTVYVLEHTFTMPRTRTEELSLLVQEGLCDQDSESALGVTTSFQIVKEYRPIKDEGVLFNPYIWRANHDKIAHVVVRLPDDERDAVQSSLELVSANQGLPVDQLGVQRSLLSTAHSIGLIDIVEVNTVNDDKREFAFSPHLSTHPDLTTLADDLLNDVRAVLACVGYGENYSRISQLGGLGREKTINMLRKLIRENQAGDATAIGVDYQLLEARGIISVEPTNTAPGGRFKMRLLRPEPVEVALRVIEEAVSTANALPMFVTNRALDPGTLFASPEQTRMASPSAGKQPLAVAEARETFLKKIRKEVF
jgi:hypothetical protein